MPSGRETPYRRRHIFTNQLQREVRLTKFQISEEKSRVLCDLVATELNAGTPEKSIPKKVARIYMTQNYTGILPAWLWWLSPEWVLVIEIIYYLVKWYFSVYNTTTTGR